MISSCGHFGKTANIVYPGLKFLNKNNATTFEFPDALRGEIVKTNEFVQCDGTIKWNTFIRYMTWYMCLLYFNGNHPRESDNSAYQNTDIHVNNVEYILEQ